MTKKDYEKFADMLLGYRCCNLDEDGDRVISVLGVAQDIADIFAADNPRFDRERFLQACGIE